MKMIPVIRIAAAATVVIVSCLVGSVKSATRPNIVIIVADDLGWSDVGFHSGDVSTPNIDALGYNGISFTRHYTQPLCTPSRTALLTGDYPIRHGMQGEPCIAGVADGLPSDVKLMPQYFAELGYKTHLIGKWHLGYETKDHLPTYRGFDSFFGYLNGYLSYWDGTHLYKGGRVGRDIKRGEEGAWREVYGKYLTEVLTNEAVNVIQRHDDSESMLLILGHNAVHTTLLSMIHEAPPDVTNTTDRGILRGMARWLDWSVGEVVAALDRKKILDNTIIVFLSDNGAPTANSMFRNAGSNWPFRGLKASVHEGGIRTAALLYSKLLKQKQRVTEQIFHISDWLPTLYSAAGGKVEDLHSKDGIDQWKSLISAQSGPRDQLLVDIDEVSNAEAYIMGNWKLLRSFDPRSSANQRDRFYSESGEWWAYDIEEVMNSTVGKILGVPVNWDQLKTSVTVTGSCDDRSAAEQRDCHNKYCLYDIVNDPTECHDLASTNSTLVDELRTRLEKFRQVLVPQVPKLYNLQASPKRFNDYWSPWISRETYTGRGMM